ncbi:MAG: hypothetical protein M1470_08845 [Bacteroidetes bacterium]|nr:hypothetical protein [Bacteroidota bacterium]MCL5738034.1 hypothetical protein [Bacteroidota bacterium]
MKTIRLYFAVSVAAILAVVSSVTTTSAETHMKLTQKDCSSIFSWTQYCQTSRTTDGELYCKAWFDRRGFGDDVDEFLGYVFAKPLLIQGKQTRLLVGVTESGRISRVKLEGNDLINQEFLSQFEGKRLRDSFEIAKSLDDILYEPSRVKAIRGDIETSQLIANAVKEALSSAKKLASN